MNPKTAPFLKGIVMIIFAMIITTKIQAQLEYPAQVDTLGALETVFDFSTQGVVNDYPDAPARAFRDADGQIQLLSVHYDAFRMKGADFNSLSKDYANGPIYTSANNTDEDAYDYRTWIASPYTLDGATIYSLNHHEYFGPAYNYYNWHNTITQAISTDTGRTFQQATSPSHLAWCLPYTFNPSEGPCGYFNPSNIIQNPQDGYYYCYIHLESRLGQSGGVGLIRTNDLSNPASWSGWNGNSFAATSYNPYSGGSANPEDHVLAPLNDLNDNIGTMSSSITFNTYFNKWMLVGWSTQVINSVTVTGAYFSLSDDMIHWSHRKLLRQFTGVWGSTYPSYNYPSIIDHTDASRNFSFSGQNVYLYYTRANSATDRDLVRIPVRFNKSTMSGLIVNSTTDNTTTARDALYGDGSAISKIAGGATVTLRSAIEEANARPPYYADSVIAINFNIAGGAGVKNIFLGAAELPEIKYPVMIDGTTQNGSTQNTAASGQTNNATININLNCNGNLGLAIIGNNSTVKGMAIYNANGTCVSISEGNGNTIQGCYIGITNSGIAGAYPVPGVSAIDIGGTSNNGSSDNLIGGTNPEDQNIIVGGINLRGSLTLNNRIQGNYIGTDKTGLVAIDQNSHGIGISDSSSFNLIGGANISMRNVISGNNTCGINIEGSETGYNTILNNYIGINADATAALPNLQDGIVLHNGAHHNIVGLSGTGNIVAGGNAAIITIDESSNNTVSGNYLGTDTSESLNLGSPVGVEFKGGTCNDNLLGGEGTGEYNIIANAEFGVVTFGAGARNSYVNNIIYNISDIAIDLMWDGITMNDFQDPDPDSLTNPNNNLQNFPENVNADSVAAGVHVTANFNSTPNQQFTIQFYASSSLTGTGLAQGERFLGSTNVSTNSNGDADIDLTLFSVVSTTDYISLLASDLFGNNSEFSDAAQVQINNNNPPTSLSVSDNTIAENSASGTPIATLTGTDPDTASVLSYSFANGAGSVDNNQFTISGDQLLSSAAIDFESQPWYSIRLRCTDQGGAYFDQIVSISVINVNEAPLDLQVSTTTINENQAPGTIVGSLSSIDEDAVDSHTYAFASGTGDIDNGLFTISSGQLRTSTAFDFEAHSAYSIR
ncbi:MAG: cadherin domain-containing protein, partial [Bacteroidia bacterium]|nr:cadherin domain-containing protein [Bacteroidia bacterium]